MARKKIQPVQYVSNRKMWFAIVTRPVYPRRFQYTVYFSGIDQLHSTIERWWPNPIHFSERHAAVRYHKIDKIFYLIFTQFLGSKHSVLVVET